VVPTSYTESNVNYGTVYTFWVQSRSVYEDLSAYSNSISILAAQEPAKPVPPVTTVEGPEEHGSRVIFTWIAPDYMGSPITGYKLEIKQSDGTYSEELTQCDARRDPIPSALTCMVTKSALRTDPYNLQWGDDVWARVTAINLYGESLVSEPGNGAKLLTYPDPPINLIEDWSPKTQTTIGITWEDSAFDGGSAFTTYRVWYNQGHVVDTWVILASDLTVKTYSAINLSPAVTYKFKVEVRNIWDYSGYSLITGDNINGYSNILEVLCAYKPTEPEAPVTSIVTIAAQDDCYSTTAESWNNQAIKICS